jgi:hypothetical protein
VCKDLQDQAKKDRNVPRKSITGHEVENRNKGTKIPVYREDASWSRVALDGHHETGVLEICARDASSSGRGAGLGIEIPKGFAVKRIKPTS